MDYTRKKMFEYKTSGTCSSKILFDVYEEDGVKRVKDVQFIGGCNGNTKGISKLVEGMRVDEVIDRLKGVTCGFKPTSCPDQLATALMSVK